MPRKTKKWLHTNMTVLLDRSGSMSSIRDDMCGGFDAMMAEQRKTPGELLVTLVQFDSLSIDTVYEAKPVAQVPPLVLEPRGSTPLLDAMGSTIGATADRLDKLTTKPDKVVFVVITDGMENASREMTKTMVLERVKAHPDWEFVFLGANMDAVAEGSALGTPVASSASYQSQGASVAAAYSALSTNLRSMREGSAENMAFTEEQRKKMQTAKPTTP